MRESEIESAALRVQVQEPCEDLVHMVAGSRTPIVEGFGEYADSFHETGGYFSSIM